MSGALGDLFGLLARRGGTEYHGERVSQLEHMLQAADLARQAGAPAALVTAAALHDVGHLLHEEGEGIAGEGVDMRHEHLGADFLARWFGPEVTEVIRQHVNAKRYLCHARAGHLDGLSEASLQSLRLQGGPMSVEEATAWLRRPWTAEAVRLRRWDEEAKIEGLPTSSLSDLRSTIETCLK